MNKRNRKNINLILNHPKERIRKKNAQIIFKKVKSGPLEEAYDICKYIFEQYHSNKVFKIPESETRWFYKICVMESLGYPSDKWWRYVKIEIPKERMN